MWTLPALLPPPRRRRPAAPAAGAARRAAERHRADLDPRHRAVRRVAAPRAPEGRRAGQRAARGGLHLFPAGARPDRRQNGLRAARGAARGALRAGGRPPSGRADDVRLAEVRRVRKENFEAHAGPDTQARQLVPGRSWAAWARALGRLLPPLKVADLGCGEGYLTLEASRWATRVLAVDHSDRAAPRAGAGGAAARPERDLEARRARKAADPRRQRRRRAAVAGAAPRRAIRSGPSLRPRASSCPAGGCWCSTCASITKHGSATGSATGGSGSATRGWPHCSTAPASPTSRSASGRGEPATPSRC